MRQEEQKVWVTRDGKRFFEAADASRHEIELIVDQFWDAFAGRGSIDLNYADFKPLIRAVLADEDIRNALRMAGL